MTRVPSNPHTEIGEVFRAVVMSVSPIARQSRLKCIRSYDYVAGSFEEMQ